MWVVGLTGGIGSGKTTVADLFARHGVPVIDTDRIAHELTSRAGKAMPLVVAQFGQEYADRDGSLDRPMMRRRVFGDPLARTRLEAILHPLIRQEVEAQLRAVDAPYAIVVIPLLVERGGYDELLDRVLVVDCDPNTQIARTMARNGLQREEVQAILDAQADRALRLSRADDVIDNQGDPKALADRVRALNEKYSAFAHRKP